MVVRIDWSKIPKETKEKMLLEVYNDIKAPCSYQDRECIMGKMFGLDCEANNESHCAFRDFIGSCLKIK